MPVAKEYDDTTDGGTGQWIAPHYQRSQILRLSHVQVSVPDTITLVLEARISADAPAVTLRTWVGPVDTIEAVDLPNTFRFRRSAGGANVALKAWVETFAG